MQCFYYFSGLQTSTVDLNKLDPQTEWVILAGKL